MEWKNAITVDGKVDGAQLGYTYVHEHLIVQPQISGEKYEPYTLKDEQASAKEAQSFARLGEGTIVEMSPIKFGRDAEACRRIAHEANIHVICCTGYHKQEFMPSWFESKSDSELYDVLMDEVENGMDGSGIRPGVIKFGTGLNTITFDEERAIKAVARVHLDTGIPISTHCDKGTMGLEQIHMLEKLGVDPARVLLCHVDIPKDAEYVKALCETGANVCFDHLGREYENVDAFKVNMIYRLWDAGFGAQITLAGDMGKKEYLPAYGGAPGFAYILGDLKRVLLKRLSREEFDQMMIKTPRRIFAGA